MPIFDLCHTPKLSHSRFSLAINLASNRDRDGVNTSDSDHSPDLRGAIIRT